MPTMTLEKQSLRRLDAGVMRDQLTRIAARALGGGRGRTWSLASRISVGEPTADNGSGLLYQVRLRFERTGRKAPEAVLNRQWQIIQKMAATAGNGKGWTLPDLKPEPSVDEQEQLEPRRPRAAVTPERLVVPQGKHFTHLFERDSQIALVQSALDAYVTSAYEDRFHCVLFGPPACGKTEILRSFARMLGEDAVLTFDATSTTKAGAERILLETERIPPVLIVEEIEKTDEASLRWLLGVLDHRAEIRKITYRMVAAKSVKLLCLATVNDIGLFRRIMDGALASRFSHHIHCPRPSRAVLQRILEREVARAGGDRAWIEPTLDWCLNREPEQRKKDPRRAITVCLSGRERLLTGEYQRHLAATMEP